MGVRGEGQYSRIDNRWRKATYTALAPIYNLVAGYFTEKRRQSIALAAPQAGERVLLLGAGTGLDLDFLPPGLEITAIDLTPAMLERLKGRARRLGLAVEARVMDGQALEFPDGSFDLVILHLIVAVIPDPAACLRETARVLRPGGRAVILDKFVPDGARVPLVLRLINPVLNLIATEVTRKLGPIMEGSGLKIEKEEAVGLGGYFKIALCRKD